MPARPKGDLHPFLSETLSKEQEQARLDSLLAANPPAALSLLPVYLEQKHHYKAALEELKDRLEAPPWQPATVLRVLEGEPARVLVASGGRRLAVSADASVDLAELDCGTSVFLNAHQVIIGTAPAVRPCGPVGRFARFHDGRAVLTSATDEELIVEMTPGLRSTGIKEGDFVLYDPECRIALEAVEKETNGVYRLEEVPDVRFEDIGGLDELIDELTREIELHFLHRPIAEAHRLSPLRGVTLSGPPGVGKTMLAKALANHLARLGGVEATFLNVKPGLHRSMWYGQTEANIRELFALARKAAQGEGRLAVMFFDDVDQLGARSASAVSAIDSRVLPALLHEIDGMEGLKQVLLIGATNRPDLLDEALLRPHRFGDKLFRIPRPARDAARQIFGKYLVPELPYWNGSGAEQGPARLIETALSMVYAPNGERHRLATLTFRDGSKRPLTAPELMSGALIANVVAQAKRRSCFRALAGEPVGIAVTDLLGALDAELKSVVERLKPGPALRELLELPPDLDVVKIEPDPMLALENTYQYLNTA